LRIVPEPQPLHGRDRLVALRAGSIDPGFIARGAADPHRLRVGDASLAQAGNGRRQLPRDALPSVGLVGGEAGDGDQHIGRSGQQGFLIVAVDQHHRLAGNDRLDGLEAGQFRYPEGQHRELLVDRDLGADRGRGQHLADRLIRILLGSRFRDIDGDVAGDFTVGHNDGDAVVFRAAVRAAGAAEIGPPGRGLEADGVFHGRRHRFPLLDGDIDRVEGGNRQLPQRNRQVVVGVLEAHALLQGDHPLQRHEADPGAGRVDRVGGVRRAREHQGEEDQDGQRGHHGRNDSRSNAHGVFSDGFWAV